MPDETTNTNQDPLPGNNQGPASEGNTGSTSQPAAKTYTDSDVQKAVSDALAKAGRDAKSLDGLRTTLEAQKAEYEQWKKEKEERELEEIKDDPDKLSLHQLRKKVKEQEEALKTREAKLAESESAHQDELTFAQKVKRSTLMGEIAGEFQNSDPELLEKTCDSLGIGNDPEKIRIIAGNKWSKLPNGGGANQNLHTDTGKNVGGDDWSKKSPEEKIKEQLRRDRQK